MTGLLGRKCLAVLAVLGLIAALLAVNPRQATADADNPDVDNPAEYSACVGAAAADAGFEDIEGISGEDAINCLAHYNIAQGRTETMFSPVETITRWQMALFLSRAAGPAGVVLPASPTDQGFTDIGALSEAAQAAANNLAELGIMPGTSATTFAPNTSVSRGSMATMLDEFLKKASPGQGGADVTKLSPDDNVFTDIATVARNQYISIRRVYELGITKGVTETLYRPTQSVTREQMALFISRTLAHTVARPAGLSIQSLKDTATGSGSDGRDGEDINLVISMRNDDFQAMTDVPVDVFTSTDPDTAFMEDGTCDTGTTQREGSRKCEVDGNDERTDSAGDITSVTLTVNADITIWAWTGDEGDKYDNDETTSAMLDLAFQKGATRLLVSHDLDDDQTKMKFGRTVKVTIQVADEDNNPVAKEDVSLGIMQVVTSAAKQGQTGSRNESSSTQKTDASGKIELSFTQNDPTAGNNGDTDATVVLTITDPDATDNIVLKNSEGEDPAVAEGEGSLSNDGVVRENVEGSDTVVRMGLTWSDDDANPENHTLKLSQRDEYTMASEEGRGAQSSVTATVTNEYGEPVGGVNVVFNSNDEDGIGGITEIRSKSGNTGARSGARRVSYQRDSDTGGIETIWATTSVVVRKGDCIDTADGCPEADADDFILQIADADADGALVHYWPAKADDATGTAEDDIIVIRSTEDKTIVFKTTKGECPDDGKMAEADDMSTPDVDESEAECTETDDTSSVAVYDDNDHFTVGSQPVTMEDFEKELDAKNEDGDPKYTLIELVNYSDTASDVSSFTISEASTS